MTTLLGIAGIVLALSGLTTACFIAQAPVDEPRDVNVKWLGGTYAAVCCLLFLCCVVTGASKHCEALDDDEYKLIQKFRIERKQQQLTKDLEKLLKENKSE